MLPQRQLRTSCAVGLCISLYALHIAANSRHGVPALCDLSEYINCGRVLRSEYVLENVFRSTLFQEPIAFRLTSILSPNTLIEFRIVMRQIRSWFRHYGTAVWQQFDLGAVQQFDRCRLLCDYRASKYFVHVLYYKITCCI